MGTIKFFLVVVILPCLSVAMIRPVAAMTLEECVAIALRNNPGLQKERIGVQWADREVADQRSRDFGSLDLISTYNHYNLPRTLAPLTPSSFAGDPSSVATTRDLFTSGIVYEVPLFTGFARTRAVEIAGLQKEMAAARLRLSREQLIYNVRSLYMNILSQQARARAQDAYVRTLRRLYDDIERELQQGRKARIDLLKAAADLQNGEAGLARLRSNISILRSSLASLMNSEPGSELEEMEISATEMAEAQDTFSRHLPELARLRTARLAVEKSRRLAEKERSSLYPQIVASVAYGQNYGPNDSTNLHSGDWQAEEVWQAGLNLRWNLFDFGSSRARIQKAHLAARQSVLAEKTTELEIRKSLHEAVSQINTAISDYTSARAEVTMTRETQAIEQVRFDRGAADINDLLTARARNLAAEGRLIEAGYRYRTARFYLDYLLEKGEKQ